MIGRTINSLAIALFMFMLAYTLVAIERDRQAAERRDLIWRQQEFNRRANDTAQAWNAWVEQHNANQAAQTVDLGRVNVEAKRWREWERASDAVRRQDGAPREAK